MVYKVGKRLLIKENDPERKVPITIAVCRVSQVKRHYNGKDLESVTYMLDKIVPKIVDMDEDDIPFMLNTKNKEKYFLLDIKSEKAMKMAFSFR